VSQALQVALIRALLGALVTAGAVFFGTLASGAGTRTAGIAAGAAAFAYLVTRGGAEGLWDSSQGPAVLKAGP